MEDNVKEERNIVPDKILVTDNEVKIADLTEMYLNNEDYSVSKFYSAKEALECINTANLDLAILDVILPDIDGYTLCQKIGTGHTYPIVMLTARDGETDKINGLTLGADDYMTRPFRPSELVTRVRFQLRRYEKYNPAQAEAEAGDAMIHVGLEMNVRACQRLLDGKSLALTPAEFSVLQILLGSKGTIASVKELLYRIWADGYYSETNNIITSHIRHLGGKPGDVVDNPKYARTI